MALQAEEFKTEIDLNGHKVAHSYSAYPKQVQFHKTRARYVLFGGARGPGKSYALSQHILRQALKWPGIPILLLRKDLKDLKMTTEKEWLKVCPPELYDPKFGGQHNRSEHWYRLFNGSTIYLGDLKDWESYKSMTVGLIAIDELNEVEEDAYINMDAALRWTTGEGVCDFPECQALDDQFVRQHPRHPFYQIAACTNPAPGWVKARFWDPWKAGRERPNHAFIPATAYDNPSLPPDFIPNLLESNSRQWVENYINGDWSSFEDMVWPHWNRADHRWKGPPPIEDFTRIEGGIDYGATGSNSHRTAAYLSGYTKSGKIVTFWEYSEEGEASNDFFEHIKVAQRTYRVNRWQADSSQSRANQLLRESGIPVYDAPRYKGAVKDGNNLIHRLMAKLANGEPGIYVTDDCPRLMSGIEIYQLDPLTGEPLKNQEDDEVDAWRYNIDGLTKFSGDMGKSTEYTVRTVKGKPRQTASQHLTKFREERRERMRKAIS